MTGRGFVRTAGCGQGKAQIGEVVGLGRGGVQEGMETGSRRLELAYLQIGPCQQTPRVGVVGRQVQLASAILDRFGIGAGFKLSLRAIEIDVRIAGPHIPEERTKPWREQVLNCRVWRQRGRELGVEQPIAHLAQADQDRRQGFCELGDLGAQFVRLFEQRDRNGRLVQIEVYQAEQKYRLRAGRIRLESPLAGKNCLVVPFRRQGFYGFLYGLPDGCVAGRI